MAEHHFDIDAALSQTFESHGSPLRAEDGWLVAGPDQPAIRGWAQIHEQHETGCSVRLDIHVSLTDGRLLIESFGGMGTDPTNASKNAFANFLQSSFHVILTGLYGRPDDQDQITTESWVVDGRTWKVFIGGFAMRSFAAGAQIVAPENLFSTIEELVRAMRLRRAAHWFRFYTARSNNESMVVELLFDNEPIPDATDSFLDLPWQPSDEFYSIRNFLVLRDANPEPFATRLEVRDAVRLAVDVWASDRELPDEELFIRLTNQGFDATLADRVIVFTPLGFSNVLLHQARLPEHYRVADAGGVGPNQRLDQEPAFNAARELALRLSDKNAFLATAGRCALLDAANQALHQGSKLEDLEFAEPVVILDRFSAPST